MGKQRWTREGLTDEGFVGWVPWWACPDALAVDRTAGGVYVVLREDTREPRFLDSSAAGTFRGDPSVSPEALGDNWVSGAGVLYIGKGDHGALRDRLRAYIGFGRGGGARHWGGRLMWQVDKAEDCLVAWRVLKQGVEPVDVETQMIKDFKAAYGKPPFANRPHLRGR
jgi:hypothetical protein